MVKLRHLCSVRVQAKERKLSFFLQPNTKMESWKQTHDNVFITIPNASNNFKATFLTHTILLEMNGTPLVNGELKHPIKPDESFWWLDDDVIEIELVKSVHNHWWSGLFCDDNDAGDDPGIKVKDIADPMKRDKAYRAIAYAHEKGIGSLRKGDSAGPCDGDHAVRKHHKLEMRAVGGSIEGGDCVTTIPSVSIGNGDSVRIGRATDDFVRGSLG